MSGIVEDILSITDDILGLRDELGAIKHPVFILTRTWSGTERGDGAPTDMTTQILPTPYVVDLSHNLNIREGGTIRQGDVLVKHISKQSYATEDLIDCSVPNKLTEKYYFINNKLYTVVSVTSDYVYWNVLLRASSKKKVY